MGGRGGRGRSQGRVSGSRVTHGALVMAGVGPGVGGRARATAVPHVLQLHAGGREDEGPSRGTRGGTARCSLWLRLLGTLPSEGRYHFLCAGVAQGALVEATLGLVCERW